MVSGKYRAEFSEGRCLATSYLLQWPALALINESTTTTNWCFTPSIVYAVEPQRSLNEASLHAVPSRLPYPLGL